MHTAVHSHHCHQGLLRQVEHRKRYAGQHGQTLHVSPSMLLLCNLCNCKAVVKNSVRRGVASRGCCTSHKWSQQAIDPSVQYTKPSQRITLTKATRLDQYNGGTQEAVLEYLINELDSLGHAATQLLQILPRSHHEALACLQQWMEFYTTWAAAYDLAEGFASLTTEQELKTSLLSSSGALLRLERSLLEQPAAYNAILQANSLLSSHISIDEDAAQQEQGVIVQLTKWLYARITIQGYHPQDPAAFSVVLSREEKLWQLEQLRLEQSHLVAEASSILHAAQRCPQVEIPVSELLMDPVLSTVAIAQGWGQSTLSNNSVPSGVAVASKSNHVQQPSQGLPSGPCGSCVSEGDNSQQRLLQTDEFSCADDTDISIELSIAACDYLLQCHPDASIRQQVYQMGIQQRAQRILQLWPQLQMARLKTARMYGLEQYSQLVHAQTLLSSSSALARFLQDMKNALEPAVQQTSNSLLGSRALSTSPCQSESESQHTRFISSSDLLWLVAQASGKQLQAPSSDCYNAAKVVMDAAHTIKTKLTTHEQVYTTLSIDTLVMGVSQLTRQLMGVWLQPYTQQDAMDHCGSLPVMALLQQLIHDTSERARVTLHTVHHEEWGEVGTIIVHPRLGQGARWLDQNQRFVLLGLQHPVHMTPAAATAFSLRELLHELGHAFHMLLATHASAASSELISPTPQAQQQQGTTPVTGFDGSLPVPGASRLAHMLLPLELVEVPSSLLELLVTQTEAVERILKAAAGDDGSSSIAAAVSKDDDGSDGLNNAHIMAYARAVVSAARSQWYNPIYLQLQVLTCMLDAMLCDTTNTHVLKDDDIAAELWAQLCTLHLPQELQPTFVVYQLQSLQRTLELQGKGYAYLTAWAVAAAAWLEYGLCKDSPCSPDAWSRLRHHVYESGTSSMMCDMDTWLQQLTGQQFAIDAGTEQGAQLEAQGAKLTIPVCPKAILHFCWQCED